MTEPVRKIAPTDWQARVLSIPERLNIAMLGGRGPGKSHGIGFSFLQHLELYKDKARCLFVRRSFPGCMDFVNIMRTLLVDSYGPGATYSQASHVFTLPYGYLEIGMLDDVAAFSRYQGRSFSLIAIDELTQFPEPSQVDLLWSCLRSGEDIPTRMVVAANPGLAGHAWVNDRYNLTDASDWEPFVELSSGQLWVRATGTFRDNPHLASNYETNLTAASSTDEGLQRAWLSGDWSAVAAGAFFATVLDQQNQVDPWPTPEESQWWVTAPDAGWDFYLSHDYGSSAPSVTLACALSPGGYGPDGEWYSRGSIIAFDELATCLRDSQAKGLEWPIPKLADAIKDLACRWGMKPNGVADDACFARHGHAAGSISDEFKGHGVRFRPARKADRVTGWTRLRRLMAGAGKPDSPGVYISRSCAYTWKTLPYLPRCPRRVEDVDTNAIDHAADCLRYATMITRPRVESRKFRWA